MWEFYVLKQHLHRLTRSSLIHAPLDDVWVHLADLEAWPKWFEGLRACNSNSPIKPGSTVHIVGTAFDFEAVVEEFESRKSFTLKMVEGRFGPVYHWELQVTVEEIDAAMTRVTLRQRWAGTVPVFAFIFTPLIRGQMKKMARASLAGLDNLIAGNHKERVEKPPWWSPAEPISRSEVVLLATMCAYAVVMGYMTSLTSAAQHQIIESFHSDDAGLGTMFFFIGIGAIPGLVILPFGDRIGRRRILLPVLALTSTCTFLSTFAPNLTTFTALQAVVRAPMFVALALAWIYVIEEMPAGARAYSLSVFTMCGGLGGGTGLVLLPIVMRISPEGWRILYGLAALALLTVPIFARHLHETRRFERAWHGAPFATLVKKPHLKWTILVGVLALFSALYGSPAGRFQGRYIQNALGYTPGMYVLFTVVTTLPGGAGMIIGGRLADSIGRRKVGITAATVGATSQALLYWLSGAPLWIASSIGSLISAMWIPALGSYTTELFPTSLRSSASTVSHAVGMGSGAAGTFVAGLLIVSLGGYAPAILVLLPFALISAFLMYLFFPETARRELEEISPDIAPPAGLTGGGIGSI